MKAAAFVAVGSNIAPDANIPAALGRLAEVAELVAVSTFYRVRPLDRPEQPDFRNGVVQIETQLDPVALHRNLLREIEEWMGRERSDDKHAARPIDLDLVLYEDVAFREGDLVVPDPDITARNFLAVPLAELAPALELPGDGRTLGEIATKLGRTGLLVDRPLSDTLKEMLKHE